MRMLVRLIALVAGVVVAAAGALLVIETVWAWAGPGVAGLVVPWQQLPATLGRSSWAESSVLVAAVVAIALGLLLLLLVALSGRKEIRLHDPAPEVTVTTDPRSLARVVGHHVREQGDVSAASVTATRRSVHVKATGRFSSVGDLKPRLSESTERTVRELPLRSAPRVSVSVSPTKERR